MVLTCQYTRAICQSILTCISIQGNLSIAYFIEHMTHIIFMPLWNARNLSASFRELYCIQVLRKTCLFAPYICKLAIEFKLIYNIYIYIIMYLQFFEVFNFLCARFLVFLRIHYRDITWVPWCLKFRKQRLRHYRQFRWTINGDRLIFLTK